MLLIMYIAFLIDHLIGVLITPSKHGIIVRIIVLGACMSTSSGN